MKQIELLQTLTISLRCPWKTELILFNPNTIFTTEMKTKRESLPHYSIPFHIVINSKYLQNSDLLNSDEFDDTRRPLATQLKGNMTDFLKREEAESKERIRLFIEEENKRLRETELRTLKERNAIMKASTKTLPHSRPQLQPKTEVSALSSALANSKEMKLPQTKPTSSETPNEVISNLSSVKESEKGVRSVGNRSGLATKSDSNVATQNIKSTSPLRYRSISHRPRTSQTLQISRDDPNDPLHEASPFLPGSLESGEMTRQESGGM
jgi:hypothetical protein